MLATMPMIATKSNRRTYWLDDGSEMTRTEKRLVVNQVSELIAEHPGHLIPLEPEAVEEILTSRQGLVAMNGEQVVGFGWLFAWGEWPVGRNVVELRSWVVRDGFQGHGIGKKLLRSLVHRADWLWENVLVIATVYEANRATCRTLTSIGAREISRPPLVKVLLHQGQAKVRTFELSDV